MIFDSIGHLSFQIFNRLKGGIAKSLSLCVIIVIVLLALFNDGGVSNRQTQSTSASFSSSHSLELEVINVNSVIARQFNLKSVAGVLVNTAPTGTIKRLLGLRRGDIILKYNNVTVRSANHLASLMYQSHAGQVVTFLVSRKGRIFSTSAKIPQRADNGLLNPRRRDIFVAIAILGLIFTALFLNLINRTVCVTLGAVLMLVAGSFFGFYDQTKAFDSIRMSPILIFIGMSIFAIFLESLRFFDYVAKKMIVHTKADVIKVVFGLCLMTYFFSLFVNNLSTILVIIPITLYVSRGLNINPIPVVVAEIISSNIGGASTMIGDFPNMLISMSTGLIFFDFLIFMTPICFVLLLSLFWYMRRFEFIQKKNIKSPTLKKGFIKKMEEQILTIEVDWACVKKVLFILSCVIVGFMVLPFFRIKTATIALAGGFILLALENKKARGVLKKIRFTDVIFFISLFIIVGGALYSGLLKGITDIIVSLSVGNKMLYLILLIWGAAFFTAFLNAGPATVFFIPIVTHSHFAGSSDLVWWALSLGVLAGSSATITGATAGIVTQTILDEYNSVELKGKDRFLLTFSKYNRKGIPIALMFLVISSIYIIFLSTVPGVK
ncbi:MAG: hypothetical protein JSW40_00595 [Candidatus Omnitrophota bacterium]|nr:MAG: hypothetical protein JSW40_00595 [Candidatus Omnitrophota bacterium]